MDPQRRERIRKGVEQYTAARYTGMDAADAALWMGYRELEWVRYLDLYAEDRRNRIARTRALCPHKVWLVDLHSHSAYSDGRAANIGEVSYWAERHGVDLQTVADHDTIAQAADIPHFQNLALGEEVVTNDGHHVVGIEVQEVIDPERKPLKARMEDVRKVKGYAILAHPCGWRTTIYPEAQIAVVFQLEGAFGMEIGNGACNLYDYYDVTDANAVRLWDRLLCAGRHVVAFGNTDAHSVLEFGMVWNAFVGTRPTRKNLKGLCAKGRHFVGDGPFVFLRVNDTEMGGKCKVKGGKVKVSLEAYDSVGVAKVRVIKNGKLLKALVNRKESGVFCAEIEDSVDSSPAYYRVEAYAVDNRKGFTNPVWVSR